MDVQFVGALFRHGKVALDVYSIELTATDSVWTTADGLLPQLGGVYVTINNRTEPSHILFDRCRFHGQVCRLHAAFRFLFGLSLRRQTRKCAAELSVSPPGHVYFVT